MEGNGSHEFDISAHLDGVLLGRIQAGDESALAELYDSRGRLVYSVVLHIVRNEHDAEELTQEVFLRVWEKADSFDVKRGSPLAWIVTIARRLAIDRTRSKGHRAQKNTVELEPEIRQDAGQPDPEGTHQQVILNMVVGKALARLKELNRDHREVIELAYYGGLSHAEIAEQISIPLGTVKSRLRAAISHLREILGADTK